MLPGENVVDLKRREGGRGISELRTAPGGTQVLAAIDGKPCLRGECKLKTGLVFYSAGCFWAKCAPERMAADLQFLSDLPFCVLARTQQRPCFF